MLNKHIRTNFLFSFPNLTFLPYMEHWSYGILPYCILPKASIYPLCVPLCHVHEYSEMQVVVVDDVGGDLIMLFANL